MTILPAHTQRIIFHKAMASAHLIAAEFDCAVSDVLDLLVTAPFTPSQPEETSRSHAPAAQTDGGGLPSLGSLPSVDLSGLAAHEQGPSPETSDAGAHGWRNDEPGAAVESVLLTTDSQANTGGKNEVAPPSSNTDALNAADAGGQRADAEALGSAVETGALSLRDRIVAAHREHPDWPPKLLAEHCGTREEQVRNAAQKRNLKLPTWWDYQRALQSKTTEALKAAPAKPQEPVERAGSPTPRSEVPQPAAVPPTPAVESDASDVLHRVKKAPSGRFYLRDKTTLEFVHQSLAPSPNGSGPMMTRDRKWAWYDTMQRYRGAKKRWPELADMRKEAAAK